MRLILSVMMFALEVCCNTVFSQPSVPPEKEPGSTASQGQSAAQGPSQGNKQATDPAGPLDKANQALDFDTDGGVVTNQAITVAGQDFYSYFVAAWREKDGSERYTIGVRERPSARFGTEVWVEYRQRRVFRTYLPPARAAIRAISESAAEVAYQAIKEADLQNQLIRDADLGRDEF